MPNSIGVNGLEVQTQAELVAQLTAGFQTIYGADIDLDSDTPDGEMMGLFIQAVLDLSDLLVQIYNTFDPDNAIGVVLDQRVAINGIQRQAGTHTVTNVTLTISQALNLFGVDQEDEPVFIVSDNAGNQFELQDSQNILAPGTYVFSFQAVDPGAVLTIPNTITVPVTVVLGVTAINNPSPATSTGLNEESDDQLKVRRQKSVSLASTGYLAGLYAALRNINGVTSVFVYENLTGATDGDGIPSHSIWVIVAGTAEPELIAQAIYTKRSAGCGMFGDEVFTITQIDGTPFQVKWDLVTSQNLFIAFTVSSIDGINRPNIAAIRSGLPANFVPEVNQEVDINRLATAVQELDPNALVTNAGFSTGQSQILTLSGVAASGGFKVKYNGVESALINWNDAIGTIQTKVQAVTGLTGALVTGSIASQALTFNLAAVSPIQTLLVVTTNTLATSAPAAITFSYNENYSNTLSPSSKAKQFVLSSADIVILPMLLTPSSSTVAAGGTQQMTGLGGYGTLVYSISINNSEGSIDASTGLYTAGVIASMTDTVKVTDVFGNSATATVAVT